MRGQLPVLLVLLLLLVLTVAAVLASREGAGPAAATVTVTRTVTETVTALSPQQGCGELLADREYYPRALELIQGAEKCICLAMFLAKYDPGDSFDPANDLLLALAAKARQGVKVMVLLDDETLERYPETVELLLAAGAEVRLDESSRRLMHAKMLIVDNETVLVGSHNWTESGLWYNHEASLETSDPAVAGEAVEYFSLLWSSGRPV